MKLPLFIVTVLIAQVSASFFDVFQGAVLTVQNSFGKLISDVVTDVKETVDCTILAVEHVLALSEDATTRYYGKCGNVANSTDLANSTLQNASPIEISVQLPNNEEYLQEIDDRINKSLSKVLSNYNPHEKLKSVENALAKESEQLYEVSNLVKRELQKIPNDSHSSDSKPLDGNLHQDPSVNSILQEIRILESREQNTNNGSEAQGIHQVIDKVLDKLNVLEATEASENVKLEEILSDLEKISDGGYEDLRKQFEQWKEEESKQLHDVIDEMEVHEILAKRSEHVQNEQTNFNHSSSNKSINRSITYIENDSVQSVLENSTNEYELQLTSKGLLVFNTSNDNVTFGSDDSTSGNNNSTSDIVQTRQSTTPSEFDDHFFATATSLPAVTTAPINFDPAYETATEKKHNANELSTISSGNEEVENLNMSQPSSERTPTGILPVTTVVATTARIEPDNTYTPTVIISSSYTQDRVNSVQLKYESVTESITLIEADQLFPNATDFESVPTTSSTTEQSLNIITNKSDKNVQLYETTTTSRNDTITENTNIDDSPHFITTNRTNGLSIAPETTSYPFKDISTNEIVTTDELNENKDVNNSESTSDSERDLMLSIYPNISDLNKSTVTSTSAATTIPTLSDTLINTATDSSVSEILSNVTTISTTFSVEPSGDDGNDSTLTSTMSAATIVPPVSDAVLNSASDLTVSEDPSSTTTTSTISSVESSRGDINYSTPTSTMSAATTVLTVSEALTNTATDLTILEDPSSTTTTSTISSVEPSRGDVNDSTPTSTVSAATTVPTVSDALTNTATDLKILEDPSSTTTTSTISSVEPSRGDVNDSTPTSTMSATTTVPTVSDTLTNTATDLTILEDPSNTTTTYIILSVEPSRGDVNDSTPTSTMSATTTVPTVSDTLTNTATDLTILEDPSNTTTTYIILSVEPSRGDGNDSTLTSTMSAATTTPTVSYALLNTATALTVSEVFLTVTTTSTTLSVEPSRDNGNDSTETSVISAAAVSDTLLNTVTDSSVSEALSSTPLSVEPSEGDGNDSTPTSSISIATTALTVNVTSLNTTTDSSVSGDISSVTTGSTEIKLNHDELFDTSTEPLTTQISLNVRTRIDISEITESATLRSSFVTETVESTMTSEIAAENAMTTNTQKLFNDITENDVSESTTVLNVYGRSFVVETVEPILGTEITTEKDGKSIIFSPTSLPASNTTTPRSEELVTEPEEQDSLNTNEDVPISVSEIDENSSPITIAPDIDNDDLEENADTNLVTNESTIEESMMTTNSEIQSPSNAVTEYLYSTTEMELSTLETPLPLSSNNKSPLSVNRIYTNDQINSEDTIYEQEYVVSHNVDHTFHKLHFTAGDVNSDPKVRKIVDILHKNSMEIDGPSEQPEDLLEETTVSSPDPPEQKISMQEPADSENPYNSWRQNNPQIMNYKNPPYIPPPKILTAPPYFLDSAIPPLTTHNLIAQRRRKSYRTPSLDYDSFFRIAPINSEVHQKALAEARQLISNSRMSEQIINSVLKYKTKYGAKSIFDHS